MIRFILGISVLAILAWGCAQKETASSDTTKATGDTSSMQKCSDSVKQLAHSNDKNHKCGEKCDCGKKHSH